MELQDFQPSKQHNYSSAHHYVRPPPSKYQEDPWEVISVILKRSDVMSNSQQSRILLRFIGDAQSSPSNIRHRNLVIIVNAATDESIKDERTRWFNPQFSGSYSFAHRTFKFVDITSLNVTVTVTM